MAAQSSGEPEYGGWFENTGNYDGTVDGTGREEVRITVGAKGNGGHFAFDPPAVRIDPGTTVVWEWSGKGGAHNVAAENGDFESEMTDEAGHTFERTVERRGIVKYACVPHEAMGMKGALVVGGAGTGSPPNADLADTLAIGGGIGLAGALFAVFALGTRSEARKRRRNADR
ncbi:halocyanin domain-containing protein [Halomarina pelagica]|uniref:halocyanin domain-containing protein n=1 Tax=Halomarina pelagica TaxID=2961599 RepID=UPI0020C4B760|nr:halocyanin domain-containing protein [Halomarina sp. BND7]